MCSPTSWIGRMRWRHYSGTSNFPASREYRMEFGEGLPDHKTRGSAVLPSLNDLNSPTYQASSRFSITILGRRDPTKASWIVYLTPLSKTTSLSFTMAKRCQQFSDYPEAGPASELSCSFE